MTNVQKDAISKAPVGRTRRSPLVNRGKLHVNRKDPDYEYRYVNDEGDKIADKIDRGWEVVLKSETAVGDKRVDTPSTEGAPASISVGQGMKSVLMKIRKDWYEEDQLIKQQAVDKLESATRAEALDGNYGKVEITRK